MADLAWHPHPDVWLLVAVLAGGYAWAVRAVGPALVHPVERVVSRREVAAFTAGVATLWFASDWPVHEIAETRLYSAHMLQHVLMALVAPPLLLTGTPAWMQRWLVGTRGVLRGVRFATRPAVALVAFNVVLAAIHIPGVVAAMVRSEVVHFATHAALFVTAMCMWSPVMSKLIELPRLSDPGKMFYLFLQSLVPTVPASFLTFGSTVLYPSYAVAGGMWGIDPITDQRIAGLLMKLGGGFILWGVIAVFFFRWSNTEEREGVDVLEWGRIERDLGRVELTR